MNTTAKHSRIYGLDILRAAAIIFVMHTHGYEYSQHLADINSYKWILQDGVGLFFVLSGFLIGGILLKTVNKEKDFTFSSLRNFWLRRWFRTLPNYYLVLTLLVVLYFISHHELPPKVAHYYTFTQNFASSHPKFFFEAWSLPVEEWFYLLIPFALYIILHIARGNRKYILWLIAFVLIAVTSYRISRVWNVDLNTDLNFGTYISNIVLTRLDGIMYGMLGAWLAMYKPDWWAKNRNTLFYLGLILLIGSSIGMAYSHSFYAYIYYTTSSVGTLFLLPKLSSIKTGKGPVYRALTSISIVSYSMYLTNHMIVIRAIMPKLQGVLHMDAANSAAEATIALGLFWALTLIISYIMYRFWEQPMMKLRDKF